MRKYKHIPPLRALKAFESSARHLSFTKASEELFVTQAAISLQIKTLEEKTGVKLFKRFNRSLQLTNEGQFYLTSIIDPLGQLETVSKKLIKRNETGPLNISLLPSFATKWMAKRIWKFQNKFPDIDVSISAFETLSDANNDNFNVAIKYGRGNWPNVYSELLLEERVYPICNKKLYKKLGDNPDPSILFDYNLLHDHYSAEDWDMWFKKANIQPSSPIKGTRYSHTVMMLETVDNSNSFALGRTPLVIDDLKRKLLFAPFKTSIASEFAYYFVCSKGLENSPQIKEFKKWVFNEAQKTKEQAQKFFLNSGIEK